MMGEKKMEPDNSFVELNAGENANESVKTVKKPSKTEKKKDDELQIIREFLRRLTPFQADALRVTIDVAENKSTLESISKTDLNAVNRYLNQEYYKEDGNDVLKIQAHRQNRGLLLLRTIGNYVSKDDIIHISGIIMRLTADVSTIRDNINSLPSRAEIAKFKQSTESVNGSDNTSK